MKDELSKDHDEVLAIIEKLRKATKQRDKTIDKIEIGLKKLKRNENSMVVKKETDTLFKELENLNIKIEKLNNELEEKLDSNPELQELKMRCRPHDEECENRKLTPEEEERKAVTELAVKLIDVKMKLAKKGEEAESFAYGLKGSDQEIKDKLMNNLNEVIDLAAEEDNLRKIIIDRTKDNPHFKDLYNQLVKDSRRGQSGTNPDNPDPKMFGINQDDGRPKL